jgi:hypothetical protein
MEKEESEWEREERECVCVSCIERDWESERGEREITMKRKWEKEVGERDTYEEIEKVKGRWERERENDI